MYIIRFIIIRFTLESGKVASDTCLPISVIYHLTNPNLLIGRFILNILMCDPGLESLAFDWTRKVNGDFQIWNKPTFGFLGRAATNCQCQWPMASSSLQLCHLPQVTGKVPYAVVK
jgi:hypothetical protein